MSLYWRGEIALGQGDLLDVFLHVADSRLKAYAVDCIGRSLCDSEGEIASDVIDRLMELWETIVATVRTTKESAEELSPFGWWFASGRFEENWGLENLRVTLSLSGAIENEQGVVKRLGEVAGRRPMEAIECLGLLVRKISPEWGFSLMESEVRRVLQVIMTSSNANARLHARRLINDLGAKGHLDYRDLLYEQK